MTLIEFLRNDEELKSYRAEWKRKMKEPFPAFNYDEYAGIDGYKQAIKEKLAQNK